MADQPAARLSGLTLRWITGLALAAGAVLLVLLAPLWVITLIVSAAAGLGMWEYTRMRLPGPWGVEAVLGAVLAAGVPASSLAGPAGAAAGFGLGLTLMAGVCLAGGGEPAERLERLQRRGWGLLYVGGLLACLLLILGLANGRLLVLFLLASVVFADTGAYFSGRFWGRRKMAPQLSPGKTVEGLVGGLAAASAAGALFAWLLLDDTGPGAGALLGLAMAAFSVLGDLLESVIKRAAGVKDSGGVLPGHGGLLDRVDGIILAGPPLLLARLLWWP